MPETNDDPHQDGTRMLSLLQHGRTQVQIADLFGVSRSTVSRRIAAVMAARPSAPAPIVSHLLERHARRIAGLREQGARLHHEPGRGWLLTPHANGRDGAPYGVAEAVALRALDLRPPTRQAA